MPRSPLATLGAACATPDAVLGPTALAPAEREQLQRLQADLRLGLPVLLQAPDTALLVAAVETLSDERCRALTATGAAELVLTRRRGAALGAIAPASTEALSMALPADADLGWCAGLAGLDAGDPQTPPSAAPSTLERASDVQATAIALARATRLLPALVTVSLSAADAPESVLSMSAAAAATALEGLRLQTLVSAAKLPMDASEAGRVHVFRPQGGDTEHYAIEIGAPDLTGPVTVRLHSACFTGDVLGSLKCDCGPQLRAAMATMAANGGGILLYLDQEGRGIGLANKLRAYALQDAGLDTVEANHWLGFEDDQRDFRIGAQLLSALGVGRVRLLTNNPAKVEMLAAEGIEVLERVPLAVGETAHNAHYLATKAAKSGHLL